MISFLHFFSLYYLPCCSFELTIYREGCELQFLVLISCSAVKTADNKVGYRCRGPPENEDVAKYKMALNSFPIIIERKNGQRKREKISGMV